jgi:hypothetical protein
MSTNAYATWHVSRGVAPAAILHLACNVFLLKLSHSVAPTEMMLAVAAQCAQDPIILSEYTVGVGESAACTRLLHTENAAGAWATPSATSSANSS